MIKGFEFAAEGRSYVCSVEERRGASGEFWWWFTVTGDQSMYAPSRRRRPTRARRCRHVCWSTTTTASSSAPNYNFFTAGEGYAGVFAKLAQQGTASGQDLAHALAEANRQILEGKGNHPTLGCVVRLARMHTIAECVDDLADALLAALRGAPDRLARQAVVQRIRSAIVLSQQFDTDASFRLETPDQLTDLFSFANALLGFDFRPHPVHPAARALKDALQGIKAYGSNDQPWVAAGSSIFWNFSSPYLAMNIFLPDPLLRGLWDWRSPFYLDVNPDPTLPPVQPHIIDFVKVTDWVDFIIEYHKDSNQWVRLLPAAIPEFPLFNAKFDPQANPPCGHDKPGGKPNPTGARCAAHQLAAIVYFLATDHHRDLWYSLHGLINFMRAGRAGTPTICRV